MVDDWPFLTSANRTSQLAPSGPSSPRLWGHEQRGPNWIIGAWVWRTFVTLKKLLGRHAEQDPPDLFEMGGACLDLLRKRVHIAEAALERAAREDRVDARSLVGEVCHLDRAMARLGAGEPHTGPIADIGRRRVVGLRIDRGDRLDEVRARRAEPRFRACHVGLHDGVVGEPGEAPRRPPG